MGISKRSRRVAKILRRKQAITCSDVGIDFEILSIIGLRFDLSCRLHSISQATKKKNFNWLTGKFAGITSISFNYKHLYSNNYNYNLLPCIVTNIIKFWLFEIRDYHIVCL